MVSQILLVFAFVFATIAALFIDTVAAPPFGRVHFGWLAVAFWIISILLSGWK